MAREQEGLGLMAKLVISSVKEVAFVMAALGFWKEGVSAVNNAMKMLKNLVALGQLETLGKGVFRWPGCRSEWGPHAQKLTQELARILAKFPNSTLRREVYIENEYIRRRIDALVLIKRDNQAALVVFECALTERDGSLEAKRRDIENWPGALAFFGQQFGLDIPAYTFVTSNELNQILGD